MENRTRRLRVGTDAEIGVWRTEIHHAIASLPSEERWWKGLDVGLSSAAVFALLKNLRKSCTVSSPWPVAKGASPAKHATNSKTQAKARTIGFDMAWILGARAQSPLQPSLLSVTVPLSRSSVT